jgi:hypothetical protein
MRDRDQQVVAGVVAEGVVDLLEPVQVEQQQGYLPVAVWRGERLGRAFGETRPVAQARTNG